MQSKMTWSIVMSAGLASALAGCDTGADTAPSGGGGATGATTGPTSSVGSSAGGAPSSSSAGAGGASSSSSGGSSGGLEIGEWTDEPGACPPGSIRVDLTTESELADASRREGAFASDPPDTCYFLHDGVYTQSTGVLLYFTDGGSGDDARRVFVGESRDGVVVRGRASIANDVGNLTIRNLTFDLSGYQGSGSFNTLSVGQDETSSGANITIDHVSFTGDCATGLRGGHIEVTGGSSVLVDSCLIEKFGQCGGDGHLDHGVYVSAGSSITIRNNLIRENSSRGIQLYTQGGEYGTVDGVLIERNRITANGHRDYEDGIVMNATGSGTISDVTIKRNLIYGNYYSGIRFAGGAFAGIVVDSNTFSQNGSGSSSSSRSEINIDDAGGAADTSLTGNIFALGNQLINACYGAEADAFVFGENLVSAAAPGSCVGVQTIAEPGFVDVASGDFHTTRVEAKPFGAYAP